MFHGTKAQGTEEKYRERSSWYRATVERCSEHDEAGELSIEEAVHVRVPLCGQWHGRRTTCVLCSLALTLKGSQNRQGQT